MSVFISWSGERSRQVAEALRDWLPDVIPTLTPWMSSTDLERGTIWFSQIMRKLDESMVGIICLTPENLNSPWLLFESGALSRISEQAYVCTYLFGLEPTDIRDPLAQYQATRAIKRETLDLTQTINKTLSEEQQISHGRIERAFEKFWPDLEARLQTIPNQIATRIPKRTSEDMLEEILTLLRGVLQERTSRIGVSDLLVSSIARSDEAWIGTSNYTLIVPNIMGALGLNNSDIMSIFHKIGENPKIGEATQIPNGYKMVTDSNPKITIFYTVDDNKKVVRVTGITTPLRVWTL